MPKWELLVALDGIHNFAALRVLYISVLLLLCNENVGKFSSIGLQLKSYTLKERGKFIARRSCGL